ncbi:MAG: CoB--CoM heterodisulfide reductase iron-sulfur subunit A family protein [Candidatus Helarchaeota archaeon]
MNEIRIGVFVCHCGSNINGVLNCEKLKDYALTLPNVIYAENNLYTCSETGLARIKSAISEYSLNRVIVASCTPRTHEPLFKATCKEAGLNPFLFQFVNIRDQCSWVHANQPDMAQEKAKDLIRMGVSKVSLLEPLDVIRVSITPVALVIGGGISGMSAALILSNQGYQVFLVEKDSELGGTLRNLYKVFPDNKKSSDILKIKELIENNKNITIFTSSIVKNIEGFIGNFVVDIQTSSQVKQIKVGIIIVAVGAENLKPVGLYNYNGENIITQLELENLLKNGNITADNIIMIQCVGARTEERKYCSNVCCRTAIKNAMILKEQNPKRNIFILYKDIQTPSILHELNYRKAREMGIIFINYSKDKLPVVNGNKVSVFNILFNDKMSIQYDLIVLSTPMIARDGSEELAKMLKVPQDEHGFFLEAHVKLRPVDFATDGIFICGSAKWPADISSCISQGYAAASRACTILSKSEIEVEGSTAKVDKDLCIGCEICIKLCPFNAISKDQNDEIFINEVLCKGCGVCGASCIKNAITIRHFTTSQIISQINALIGE